MSAMNDYIVKVSEELERKYRQDFMAIQDYIIENPICDMKTVLRNAKTACEHNLLYKRGYIYLTESKEYYPYTLVFLKDLGYTLIEKKRCLSHFRLAGQEIIVTRSAS